MLSAIGGYHPVWAWVEFSESRDTVKSNEAINRSQLLIYVPEIEYQPYS